MSGPARRGLSTTPASLMGASGVVEPEPPLLLVLLTLLEMLAEREPWGLERERGSGRWGVEEPLLLPLPLPALGVVEEGLRVDIFFFGGWCRERSVWWVKDLVIFEMAANWVGLSLSCCGDRRRCAG